MLQDGRDIPVETRREVSAGRIRLLTTSNGKPVVIDSLWDKRAGSYATGDVGKLEPASLGRVRLVAEGADVPSFETELAPLRSLTITTPTENARVEDEDMLVRWETDEDAVGGVHVRLGGWSNIHCSFGAGARSSTVPRELVRAALASRDEQLSAGYQVLVYLARGRRLAVGDFDVSVNTALVDARTLAAP